MLTAAQLETQQQAPTRRKRSLRSADEQYREYLMERIEAYKESLPRAEMLSMANEALRELHELQAGENGQLLITEMLLWETVDEQIKRRLKLPSFRKWHSKFLPLRRAQRDPTHWQIERSDPVAAVLDRLESGDRALVIGNGAERAVYLLAAYELDVVCLFEDTATADKVEEILKTEALSSRCSAYVARLGQWLPALEVPIHLVVIDVRAVLALPRDGQESLLWQVQQFTAAEGLHALVTSEPDLAPEACLHHYPDWQRLPLPSSPSGGHRASSRGLLLTGPPVRSPAPANCVRPAV